MPARVLQNDITFLGKKRQSGDVVTDEELKLVTHQTKEALVSNKILEIEGYSAPGAVTMPAADKEMFGALQASFDRFRENTEKQLVALNDKLDAVLAGSGPAKTRKK